MEDRKILEIAEGAPWLKYAYIDYKANVRRIHGEKNHPRVLHYWTHTNYNPRTDEESFCAAGMNTWLDEAGYEKTNDPAARSFMDLPQLKDFKPGCICVFRRGNSNWMGHVSIGLIKGDKYIACLGANQGPEHSVNIRDYPIEALLGYYWPKKIILK